MADGTPTIALELGPSGVLDGYDMHGVGMHLARALADLMSCISQDAYRAGWVTGNEFVLWSILEGSPERYSYRCIDENTLNILRWLAAASGQWIIWDNTYEGGEGGERPIPLEEWRALYAAKQKATPSEWAALFAEKQKKWNAPPNIFSFVLPGGA